MADDINDLVLQRIEKVKQLRTKGINPYPIRYKPTHTAQAIKEQFGEEDKLLVKASGRIKSKRVMGKASFAHIEDASGLIQVYTRLDRLGEEKYELFKTLDLGDIIGVAGHVFKTKQGEITIEVDDVVLLAKSIRPLPVVKEKDGKVFDEFADREQRYRQRYVDLIVNPQVRQQFILRSNMITGIRNFLNQKGFIEVETPMMHAIPGGAAARPFITHHNALDMDLYLRIAPELYLKRLLVGGFDRVYELNRNFRNEGISTRHNPEFTMLELYQAYADYNDMMAITQELISTLAKELLQAIVIAYQGNTIDLTPPWQKLSYSEALKKYTGIDFTSISRDEAYTEALKRNVDVKKEMSLWKIAEEFFEEKVEENLIQPTFIIDYPKELSPLAKSREDNPEFVERFEVFIAGREMANAFSELNDPFDQRQRFEEQVKMREAGDDEAQMMDTDYITALEYGMPPAGGLGIGIDRLVMLFIDTASIKDTILFPLLKPEK
ncbi:MAG TPA: lysine--tRNA ligase [Spirochaetota bacterium]|nr:lysine--tRNA ligase [Spirochaetota bacterium]HQG41485.1 lysine--tRNA ligase [Spirochaetota bacterium]